AGTRFRASSISRRLLATILSRIVAISFVSLFHESTRCRRAPVGYFSATAKAQPGIILSLGIEVPTLREFFLEFLAWLIVAIVCAAVGIPLWLRKRRQGTRLLAQEDHDPVTWTGWEILAASFVTYFFWPGLVGFCLNHSGF